MKSFEELLSQGVGELSLQSFSYHSIVLLSRFNSLLSKWNRVINLSAHRDLIESTEKNFLDCIFLSSKITQNNILDFGSGAGFPGLVLSILDQSRKLTLVEADQKKSSFLKTVVRELKLNNVEVFSDYVKVSNPPQNFLNNKIDLIVSRATIAADQLMILGNLILGNGNEIALMISENQFNDFQKNNLENFCLNGDFFYTLPWSKIGRRIIFLRKK